MANGDITARTVLGSPARDNGQALRARFEGFASLIGTLAYNHFFTGNNQPGANTPKIVLTSQGYDAAGGATTYSRTVYATTPRHLPYPVPAGRGASGAVGASVMINASQGDGSAVADGAANEYFTLACVTGGAGQEARLRWEVTDYKGATGYTLGVASITTNDVIYRVGSTLNGSELASGTFAVGSNRTATFTSPAYGGTIYIVFEFTTAGQSTKIRDITLVPTVSLDSGSQSGLKAERPSGSDLDVDFAISDPIYQGDTSLAFSVGSGWASVGGNSSAAASSVAVTNSSTRAYPKAFGRWDTVPFQATGSTITVGFVGSHKFARNRKPFACVVFQVCQTDGTVLRSTTVTEMTLVAYGNSKAVHPLKGNIRYWAYQATLDVATSLSDGTQYHINAIAYPWIGDSGSVFSTRLSTYGSNPGTGTLPPSEKIGPLVMLANSGGTYQRAYAAVDAAAADDVGSVQTTEALALSSANVYKNIRTALAALKTYATGQGWTGTDNCILVLTGSTIHPWPGAAGTVTLSNAKVWTTVKLSTVTPPTGDGAMIGTGTSNVAIRGFLKLEGVQIGKSGSSITTNIYGQAPPLSSDALWIDQAPDIFANVSPFSYGRHTVYWTDNKFSAYHASASFMASGGNRAPAVLFRGNHSTVRLLDLPGYAVIGCYGLPNIEHTGELVGTDVTKADDGVVAFSQIVQSNGVPNLLLDTNGTAWTNFAVLGCVLEAYGATTTVGTIFTNAQSHDAAHILVQHCTGAGDRFNNNYNYVDYAAHLQNDWDIRNNSWDELYSKSDDENNSDYGRSSLRVGNWEGMYGTGKINNHIETPGSFPYRFPGIGYSTGASATYEDDRSANGSNTGGGDYSPAVGSSLLARVALADQALPGDLFGVSMATVADMGAVQVSVDAAGSLSLAPTFRRRRRA